MALNTFCDIYLPYCLLRQPDGRHAILNRAYKPLGFNTHDHVAYEDYPILASFYRLTAKAAEKASWNGSPDTDSIMLYDSYSNPQRSPKYFKEYVMRLKYLNGLKIRKPETKPAVFPRRHSIAP